MNRRERRAAAKSATTASGPSAITPAALCELGLALLGAELTAEAENLCREALRQQPDFAKALHLMGRISVCRRQHDRAVDWFASAARQTPDPEYLVSLGMALSELGRLDEALKAYDKALLFTPDDAVIWTHTGRALSQAKRYEEAVPAFQRALTLDPRLPEAADGAGRALFSLERYEQALACFNIANELRPDDAELIQARAACLLRLHRLDEAFDESARALRLNPGNHLAHNNLAFILQARGQHVDAIEHFNAALALQPDDALLRWNLALLHLRLGNFEAGWAGWEWRWKVPSLGLRQRQFNKPLWLGDAPVEGKTILLYSDEGFGDTLHFVRYAPMMAACGARVILQVHDSLCPALRGMFGVAECLALSSAVLPEFDFHCPISSLPLAFKTRLESIPASVPYLPAPTRARRQSWEDRLGPRNGRLRVGLVWSGDPRHKNDLNRSIALSALAPLLDLEVTFISLQKNARDQDQAMLRERSDILDPTRDLTDFAETAALISCLDLVISVDTSVAHLAGGLACPVWILLPFNPDFRWLLGRDESPWYPTARLFRQGAAGNWTEVVKRARLELQSLIGAPVHERADSAS